MNIKSLLTLIAPAALLALAACSDSKSYSELLSDEEQAVNAYLAHQRVINEIPADTVFETGENAPYYKIDDDGDVYMQVITQGSKTNKATNGQTIYFRYGRISLLRYELGYDDTAVGNYDDMSAESTSFKFSTTESSYLEYGYGIEMPLLYIGIDSEVNLIVKSQKGPYDEIADVVPYVYNLRYFVGKN